MRYRAPEPAPRARRARRAALTSTAFALVLALCAISLAGCETTAEKSAKLEKAAKRIAPAQQQGLSIAHESSVVKVQSATLVHGTEGTAAVLTLHNSSAKAIREVPISIALKDVSGATVYTNATPGLAKTLTSLALLPARGDGVWIDDQIPGTSARSIATKIGDGAEVSGAVPRLTVREAQLTKDPSGAATVEGTLENHSSTGQPELIVYALARRDGRVVAAGRAVLSSLTAGASAPFQAFFVGSPAGARLQLSAPPTALG
jgi:lipoprotein-anchoring transpeptidase ErfK/SrfK